MCVMIPFILDIRFVDAPAGVTPDFSTFLLRYLPHFFIARRIQPSLSLVDRKVEFVEFTVLYLSGIMNPIYY